MKLKRDRPLAGVPATDAAADDGEECVAAAAAAAGLVLAALSADVGLLATLLGPEKGAEGSCCPGGSGGAVLGGPINVMPGDGVLGADFWKKGTQQIHLATILFFFDKMYVYFR